MHAENMVTNTKWQPCKHRDASHSGQDDMVVRFGIDAGVQDVARESVYLHHLGENPVEDQGDPGQAMREQLHAVLRWHAVRPSYEVSGLLTGSLSTTYNHLLPMMHSRPLNCRSVSVVTLLYYQVCETSHTAILETSSRSPRIPN